MNLEAERAVYDALRGVFSDGVYSNVGLNRALKNISPAERPYVTRLFYGVLDQSVQFDYIIDKLADKKPQNAVVVLLKIGLYLLRYTETPAYAAVQKTVELCKLVGKKGTEGFVNAALKSSQSVALPNADSAEGLAVNVSYPVWLVQRIAAEYGFAFAKEFLSFRLPTETHIRVNRLKIGAEEFAQTYPKAVKKPSEYGYYVTHNVQNQLKQGDYLVQSLASMRAVYRYTDGIDPKTVLDVCAAPGGKAVYIKELFPLADVTACDIRPHRVELMRGYAKIAGAEIQVTEADASVYNPTHDGRFDLVICDAPCSGIGVAGKKPEILWNRKEGDIEKLAALQTKILNNAARYVREGGRLGYSTCTVFKAENDAVAERFLKENPHFTRDGEPLRLFPHTDGCDGFFAVNFLKGTDKP
jgi:16S rRNA (cytosine967-C5)-methyltransferase